MNYPDYKHRERINSVASTLVYHEEPAVRIEEIHIEPEEISETLDKLEELIEEARGEMEE